MYVPGTPNVPIAHINTWNLVIAAENYDSTVLGDNWKEFVPGLRDWNGRISGFYDVVSDTAGQTALYNALLAGNGIALQMQTAPGGGFFEGSANITGITVNDPVNNLITIEFTFVGNGSLQHLP